MSPKTMAREVIKWIQSLELGIPILHPRRDFANGYLVAAIFARYYPGELQPWSLYTGISEKLKRSNWAVIEKFFIKHEICIPHEAIEAVMHSQDGAAIKFVENMYTLLTNRSVPRDSSYHIQDIVPHFALPTTSNAIRSMAENPEKAVKVLEAHQEFLKQLRLSRKSEIRKIIKEGKEKKNQKSGMHSSDNQMVFYNATAPV